MIDIFEKDKNAPPPPPPAPSEAHSFESDYPDEMILNSEILGILFILLTKQNNSKYIILIDGKKKDMLRGLGILERTVETFEKHSRELIQRANSVDPAQLQKRSNIRQVNIQSILC